MAAGFARALGGDVEVMSGGSEPAEQVNPVVVEAMAEVGIDISSEKPERWSDDVIQSADVVVTMGCGDECPVFPNTRYQDWVLTDPTDLGIEDVRLIRDDIESRVRGLFADLTV